MVEQQSNVIYVNEAPKHANHFQVSANADGVFIDFRSLTPAIKSPSSGEDTLKVDPMGFLPHSRVFVTAAGAKKLVALISSLLEEPEEGDGDGGK